LAFIPAILLASAISASAGELTDALSNACRMSSLQLQVLTMVTRRTLRGSAALIFDLNGRSNPTAARRHTVIDQYEPLNIPW
jgi:hypothetical protein